MTVQLLPVTGIGEVTPGADLAELIATAAPWLADGDILVVTSKVVSKAEGRLVEVPAVPGPERDRAHAEAVAAETARVVATRGHTRIVATHHGFVMASAGVDNSNIDSGRLVLLPKDPDASARSLRAALARRYGKRVAVVVSDTMGRPWRNGLTDVALGAAGLSPLRDHRGEVDRYGNRMQLTQMAVADELAAAAELLKGKVDGVPVVVVRGLPLMTEEDGPGVVAELVRDASQDLFSLGTAEARAAGLRAAATLADVSAGSGDGAAGLGDGPAGVDGPPPEPGAVRRALAVVRPLVATGTALHLEPGPPAVIRAGAPGTDPATLIRFGADLHRLRAALAAEQIGTTPRAGATPETVELILTALPR